MLTSFNLSESAASLNADSVCGLLTAEEKSAIDAFYASRDTTLHWLFSPPFSDEPGLRANLLLLLFSAAETYFRRVIGEVLSMCPIAADHAAGQQIPLGSVAMFGTQRLGFSISDTKGLTSAGEIVSRTQKLLGVSIDKNTSLGVAIAQFENACTLRHAIVHSSCELLYSNRKDLKVSRAGRLAVQVDDAGAQEILQIVVNAVRSYNNRIGNEIIKRWFVHGYLVGEWASDKQMFLPVVALFSSRVDGMPANNAYQLYLSMRKTMKMAMASNGAT
jgi:hypothetical protein